MATWQEYLAQNRSRFLEEMFDFLRIPSISALPDHAPEVRRAGEWVVRRMQAAGIENIRLLDTDGHPVVYGDWLHAPGKPTILIYGHFDTQPVDPVELWSSPPFEPVLKADRVYARGASDDKGNMMTPILAIEALLQTTGELPINVKFCFEGQEEIGSPDLPSFLEANKALFACDMVFSADGGQYSEDQPHLSIGKKGLCSLEIHVKGANSDLHSGVYGGSLQNPIHAISRIVASLRDEDGKIVVDGFYDTVRPLTAADRELIAAAPFDEAGYKAGLGVPDVFGEPGYTTQERRGARPTLELNGIWGGFQGAGVKTVLPSEAHAKITCRLVPDQEPQKIIDAIAAHVVKHAPKGVTVTVSRGKGGARPYLIAHDHPGNVAAHKVLTELYGKSPYYVRTGGTLPITDLFLTSLGAYTVSFAFGLNDEQVHAPNEFYRLSSWDKAQKGYCMLLEELGRGL